GQRLQSSVLVIGKASGVALGTKALLDPGRLSIWVKAHAEAAAVTGRFFNQTIGHVIVVAMRQVIYRIVLIAEVARGIILIAEFGLIASRITIIYPTESVFREGVREAIVADT